MRRKASSEWPTRTRSRPTPTTPSRRATRGSTLSSSHGATGYLGAIFFYELTDTLPDAQRWGATGPVGLHYHRGELPLIIDMLRNEKPVYLIWDGGQNSRVSTSAEPVGEYEQAILDAATP